MVKQHSWQHTDGFHQLPKDEHEARKAECTVFLEKDYDGKLKVKAGWMKTAAANAAKTEAGKKSQEDPAMFGYSHSGHSEMTLIASGATANAISRNPAAAYDATVVYLAWMAFGEKGGYYSTGLPGLLKLDDGYRQGRPSLAGDEARSALGDKWKARLPKDRVAFCDYVAGLSVEEKADLLAVSFAAQIEAHEPRFDGRQPTRWAHLEWMAQQAGLDLAAEWTPDAAFLKRGVREALEKGLKDCGMTAKPDAKKGDLVATLATAAKAKGWLPKLLASFAKPAVAKAAPEASEGAKAKRSRPPGFLSVKAAAKAVQVLAENAEEAAPEPVAAVFDGEGGETELPASVLALATGGAAPIGSATEV